MTDAPEEHLLSGKSNMDNNSIYCTDNAASSKDDQVALTPTKEELELCQLVHRQKLMMDDMCKCISTLKEANESDRNDLNVANSKMIRFEEMKTQFDNLKTIDSSQKRQILSLIEENKMLKKEKSALQEDVDKTHKQLHKIKSQLADKADENDQLSIRISDMQSTFYPCNNVNVENKKIKCPMCEEKFETADILDNHLRVVHDLN